ncbi:AraC family transcriptional regulator [Motiliproteus sp. MSK22-1]|uniref:AraC family transcriptional regulator n=1 Tax=Motiliproteus sp. MSK22-1 TaxID=1897630 RepID=UPI00097712E4|nr:AraC family transcriptional regulator [Motiliproteus sp. MSK22-1]OMH33858.1 AraC family transcriptional regulator [Motiliproteus sp. MSK22-1]
MKYASKFAIPCGWKLMLTDMQIDPNAVLAYARLPADLFNRSDATLTPAEYFELWRGIEKAAGVREVPLLLAENFNVESFDAPIFASLCSPDFNVAARRLSHYKPLIGPMALEVDVTKDSTLLTLSCYQEAGKLPRILSLCELVFFCQLMRVGTREHITPLSIALPELPSDLQPYLTYFGCPVSYSDNTEISFASGDAARPFLTSNIGMWDFFEQGLNQKLADLDAGASTSARAKAVLLGMLPSGEATIEAVASQLAMSKRTLQRKLSAETECFQSILTSVRAELADHYLEKSSLSLSEISFLLGFQESNSFIRAYRAWKGTSPGQYREQCHSLFRGF